MKYLLSGVLLSLLLLNSCGGEKRPFTAQYTSQNDVLITYGGKQYHLNRFKRSVGLPFEYSFESDGDLDLRIDGKNYEVDSPYDTDKKKKTKKTVKKKVKKKK